MGREELFFFSIDFASYESYMIYIFYTSKSNPHLEKLEDLIIEALAHSFDIERFCRSIKLEREIGISRIGVISLEESFEIEKMEKFFREYDIFPLKFDYEFPTLGAWDQVTKDLSIKKFHSFQELDDYEKRLEEKLKEIVKPKLKQYDCKKSKKKKKRKRKR